MVWERYAEDGSSSDLWIATSVSLGPWRSRVLSANGVYNQRVSLATYGGHLFAAWVRDGAIVYADDVSGRWASHTFGARGVDPHVLAGASPAVAWTTYSEGSARPNRVYFAQRRSGTWAGGVAVNYLSVARGITYDRGPAIIYWTPPVLKMVRLASS